jgi:autotransporter-associated beta strand protein
MGRWLIALDSSSSFLRSLLVIFLSLGFTGNARADLYGTVWDLRGNFTVGSGDYIRMTGDGNGDSFKYQDGYFNHNASTMDFWGNAQIGLNNWAVFYQNGGDMNVGGYLSIARYGGSGYLEVNGGTVNSYNRQIIVGEVGNGSMTMNGGRAYSNQGVTLGANGGSAGTLSLNGGTLEAGAIWKGGGTGNLSFNGGTLKATRDEWNYISGLNSANIGGNGAVIDNNGKEIGINQALTGSGSGSVKFDGSGRTTLRQNNTYTGGTLVRGGTLMVDTGGSIANSSATVSSGATLKVNGVAGAVVLNGILSGTGTVGTLTMNAGSSLNPGDTIGKLTASSASFAAGSTYNFGIASLSGAAGAAADLLSVTGALDLSAITSSSKMNLVLQSLSLVGFNVDSQYSWTLAEAGSFTGAEWVAGTDVTDRFVIDSTGFNAGTQPGRGFNVKTASEGGLVKLVLNAVPEPTTGSLFFMAGMLWAINRRRRS